LGLVYDGTGVAAQIVQRLGADLNLVRQAVYANLRAGIPRAEQLPNRRRGKTIREMKGEVIPVSFQEREKIVLTLLVHEGLTTSAIAEVLGVSNEVVGEIVQAIIEKLKDL
jgi:DNA-directed RNA polymerase specialized sigma subunit